MIMKTHDSNIPIPNLEIVEVTNSLLGEFTPLGEISNNIIIYYHAGIGRDLYSM